MGMGRQGRHSGEHNVFISFPPHVKQCKESSKSVAEGGAGTH